MKGIEEDDDPDSNSRATRSRQHLLRATLAGQRCPELVEQMGPWQEVGNILFEALANDGVQTARRIFTTMCKHDPRLIPLVSADPPPLKPQSTPSPTPARSEQARTVVHTPAQPRSAETTVPTSAPQTPPRVEHPETQLRELPTLACPPLPAEAQLPAQM